MQQVLGKTLGLLPPLPYFLLPMIEGADRLAGRFYFVFQSGCELLLFVARKTKNDLIEVLINLRGPRAPFEFGAIEYSRSLEIAMAFATIDGAGHHPVYRI